MINLQHFGSDSQEMPRFAESLGWLFWAVGGVLSLAAISFFVAPELVSWMGNLPVTPTPFVLHIVGGLLAGGGSALVARGYLKSGAFTCGMLLMMLCLFIPLVGVLTAGGIALALLFLGGRGAERKEFYRVGLPEDAQIPDTDDLLKAPFLCLQHRMEHGEVERVALGVAGLPGRGATRLLTHLGASPEVGVELFARGAIRERLEDLEEQLRVLEARDDGLWSLKGIAETCAQGIESEIVPEQERPAYARRGITAATRYLAARPEDVDVLAVQAALYLFGRDYEGATDVLDRLSRLEEGKKSALRIGAHVLFEASGPAAGYGGWNLQGGGVR